MTTTRNSEERTLRGFISIILAVLLITLAGCENRSPEETRLAEAPPPPPPAPVGPRINLYPLTTPPPGSLQPLTGSAPLAYAPPAYTVAPEPVPPGSYQSPYRTFQTTSYAPAPQAGSYSASYTATYRTPERGMVTSGGYCTVEEMTAASSTYVPIADPPVLVENRTVQTTSYVPAQQTTSYVPAPQATSYPPAYAPTYRVSETGMATSGGYCTVEEMTAASSPYVPIADPPVLVENRYYPPAPVRAPVSYAAPDANFVYTPATAYTTSNAPYVSTVTAPAAPVYPAPVPVSPPVTTTYVATTAAPVAPQAGFSSGFRLIPAPDVPPGIHPNDAAPSQWFEIVRPGNGPIRIGRVTSTCVCVGVRVPNRYIAAGERALIEARTLSRPSANNLTYGIYVNLLEPEKVVVDADVTIRL